jgi:hypothetical protein
LPPDAVLVSRQMAYQVEAMTAMAHQLLASANQAAYCPPTYEACQVFTEYMVETSALVRYMDYFRFRTQALLANAHSLPQLSWNIQPFTTPPP